MTSQMTSDAAVVEQHPSDSYVKFRTVLEQAFRETLTRLAGENLEHLLQHLMSERAVPIATPSSSAPAHTPSLPLSDREYQVWIDWLVKDGQLQPGQLAPSRVFSNALNPYLRDPA